MGFNIADLFERAVDAVPDRTALVCGPRSLTFREFDLEANRLANHLLAQGFGHGDHIGIYGQNTAEWMIAMVAIFKIRAVPININFRYVEDELAYLFDNADLVALVHDQEYIDRIEAVREKAPELRHFVMIEDGSGLDPARIGAVSWADAIASASDERPVLPRTDDDLYMIYTGGTTGMPKGVVWRHEDVFYALGGGVDAYTNERVTHGMQLAEKAAASPAPMVTLNAPPLMHGAAQWGSLRFFFEGNTVVFVPKFSGEAIWDSVEKDKVTTLVITGDAMARPLTEALEANPDRWDLSSLFVLSSSAAIFSPSLKERLFELLPNIMIVDAIGSSEGGMNGMVVQTKGETIVQSGGVTVKAGRDAVVLDDDLNPLPPGTGVIGKLARGGNIPQGYYKDPKKTAETFVTAPDGTRYVVAGDFARHEEDGSITLLGRGSVCINTGGEKVFPEEVEEVLKTHDSVRDAVAVGVPDEKFGEAITAVVELAPDAQLDEAALIAHVKEKLASYKAPKQALQVDTIGRAPNGKVDYKRLKQFAIDELASRS